MKFLYHIFLSIYLFGIRSSAFFGNEKAQKWLLGRKAVFSELDNALKGRKKDIVWFHVASLGEFEMGKPLMEKLKEHGAYDILLTFFSPSGYEYRKENSITNLVYYLPFDREKNAKKFLDLVKPKIVFFVKNEFWMNYLFELKSRAIPTYLLSGVFRTNHPFFQYYGHFFRKGLRAFTHMFVQNKTSEKILKDFDFEQVTVAGDLRIDRTYENARHASKIPCLENFVKDKPVVILGSSWEKEESYIARYMEKFPGKLRVIVVPHDISKSRIQNIKNTFISGLLFSEFENDPDDNVEVLIVDSIGKLMSIYGYGDVAFVGGAWGSGLHNILEPAAFGLPIIFGPLIHKFPEAFELLQVGGAYSIDKYKDFETVLTRLIVESTTGNTSGEKAKQYIDSRVGVTEKIMETLSL